MDLPQVNNMVILIRVLNFNLNGNVFRLLRLFLDNRVKVQDQHLINGSLRNRHNNLNQVNRELRNRNRLIKNLQKIRTRRLMLVNNRLTNNKTTITVNRNHNSSRANDIRHFASLMLNLNKLHNRNSKRSHTYNQIL